MAEVRFTIDARRTVDDCVRDAAAVGIARGQVELNLVALVERLASIDEATFVDQWFTADRIVSLPNFYVVPSEYVTIYVDDRRPRNPEFVVHRVMLRRWA